MGLEKVKGFFDSVELLDKDSALEISLELWQHMRQSDHVLFYRKKHHTLGEGYVFVGVPDPKVLDDELAAREIVRYAEREFKDVVRSKHDGR